MNLSYARRTVTKATIENTGWQQKFKKNITELSKKAFIIALMRFYISSTEQKNQSSAIIFSIGIMYNYA